MKIFHGIAINFNCNQSKHHNVLQRDLNMQNVFKKQSVFATFTYFKLHAFKLLFFSRGAGRLVLRHIILGGESYDNCHTALQGVV